jgi:hypothetical protein
MTKNTNINIIADKATSKIVHFGSLSIGEFFAGTSSGKFYVKVPRVIGSYNAYSLTTNEFHFFSDDSICVAVESVNLTYKVVTV